MKTKDPYKDTVYILDQDCCKKSEQFCYVEDSFSPLDVEVCLDFYDFFNSLDNFSLPISGGCSSDPLDIQKKNLEAVFSSKSVYMEITKCKDSTTTEELALIEECMQIWAKDHGLDFIQTYNDIHEIDNTRKIKSGMLFYSTQLPIYDELLSMQGAHIFNMHNSKTGVWIDVMPYIYKEYININHFLTTLDDWSYQYIENYYKEHMPIPHKYYSVNFSKNNTFAYCNNLPNLEKSLKICSNILRSKIFFSFFSKTPIFQKKIKSIFPLYEQLMKIDHRHYFPISSIYCE